MMVGKIAGLARALAILLAVVAGVVTVPNVDARIVLVLLGLIAGIGYGDDTRSGLILTALVLPLVSAALALLPVVGGYLGAIAGNVGLAAAGAVATSVAVRLFSLVKGDLTGLSK
jgi:hypothetical protein